MSISLADNPATAVEIKDHHSISNGAEDPFDNHAGQELRRTSHRFSFYDTRSLLTNHSSSSPVQMKRTIEAHLVETDRRLDEASKLGTALVKQRKNLSDRLKEIEHEPEEGEIGPELRQKIAEVEKEYNEIGRESARAFLSPKPYLWNTDEGAAFRTVADEKVIIPHRS